MLLFLSLVSEFSDYLLICICVWILTVNLAIAKPTPDEFIDMQNLEIKLRYPCGGNKDATKEDLTATDVKQIFGVILLQSNTALNEAKNSIRDYVSVFFPLYLCNASLSSLLLNVFFFTLSMLHFSVKCFN